MYLTKTTFPTFCLLTYSNVTIKLQRSQISRSLRNVVPVPPGRLVNRMKLYVTNADGSSYHYFGLSTRMGVYENPGCIVRTQLKE